MRGAATHNLQDVDVDIPLGVLTVVTGVAGSGKSSLIHGSVAGRDGVVAVDQAAIRGSRRSNPATYTGLLDPIRKAFAKATGTKPALFSANSEGACPSCNGAGVIYSDLAMMAGVATPCEVCEGKRFQAEVLEYTFGGKNISRGARDAGGRGARRSSGTATATTPAAHRILERLADVGLGYVSLGQPLTTLSGGERQRLKLATHLGEKGGVYVLDEPTTGLHLADVEQLLGLLDRIVDSGKSVIVIEHHQAVMAHADWIIDLGPGRRARRWHGRLRGHTGRPGRVTRDAHRPAPRGVRRRMNPCGLVPNRRFRRRVVAVWDQTATLRAPSGPRERGSSPAPPGSTHSPITDIMSIREGAFAPLPCIHAIRLPPTSALDPFDPVPLSSVDCRAIGHRPLRTSPGSGGAPSVHTTVVRDNGRATVESSTT